MVSDEMSEGIGSAWAISRSLNQSCGQVACLARLVSSEHPLHLLLSFSSERDSVPDP